MADNQVQGNPDSMRTAGRLSANSSSVYGNQAATADSVTQTLGANKSTNNTKVINFSQRLAAGKRQAAEAHQKVSEMLPKVAAAVHDAQQAETKMNDAKTKLAAATKKKAAADKALQTAKSKLQSAQLKLAMAQATPLSPTPPSAGGSAPGPNPAAVAAAQAEVAAAEAAVAAATIVDTVATTEQQQDQQTYTKDVKAFDEANTKRKTALTRLNNLYHEETARAQAALALLGNVPTLVASPADQQEAAQLRNKITGLTDVDRLANDGELGEHAKQVEQAFNQSASGNAQTAAKGLTLMKLWGEAYEPTSVIPKANPAFVAHTSQLIQAAARGDTKAAAQIQAMSSLSQQTQFSEALVVKLGAQHLERIPLTMAEKIGELGIDKSADRKLIASDQQVLTFLGDSLASASHSDDPAVADLTAALVKNGPNTAGSENQLPGADPNNPDQKGAGYWGLGQILGAASGKVPFDPGFVKTIGTQLVNFEKNNSPYLGPFQKFPGTELNVVQHADNIDLPLSYNELLDGTWDKDLPGADPIYGVLHAASLSTASAQAFLGNTDNLNYSLAHGYQYEDGYQLGNALQAATTGTSQAAASIAAATVNSAAPLYQNGTYSKTETYLNRSLATILGRDLPTLESQLESSVTTTGGPLASQVGKSRIYTPNFGTAAALRVLGSVEQDPTAAKTIGAYQLQLVSTELNRDAASGNVAVFRSDLTNAASGFTVLEYAKQLIAQHAANASAGAKTSLLNGLNEANELASFIPPLSTASKIAGDLITFGKTQVTASRVPTIQGATDQLDANNVVAALAADAILSNPALSSKLTSAGYPKPDIASVGNLSQADLTTLRNWFSHLQTGTGKHVMNAGFDPAINGGVASQQIRSELISNSADVGDTSPG